MVSEVCWLLFGIYVINELELCFVSFRPISVIQLPICLIDKCSCFHVCLFFFSWIDNMKKMQFFLHNASIILLIKGDDL